MNAHIINIESEEEFTTDYLPNGYLSVGIAVNDSPGRHYGCKTSYSIFADMKTVLPGDIIFVHTGGYIYGAFTAATSFKEDPTANIIFHSGNVHYLPKPDFPDSGWRRYKEINGQLPDGQYLRQIAIQGFVENANNLCFENGFNANEVFSLKRKGKIWSVPERWKYPDSARTIRPLTISEANELLRLLERENSNTTNRRTVTPKNLDDYLNIGLILDNRVVTDEKIIEAWVCENIGDGSFIPFIGAVDEFYNNVQIGYLQGIDILGISKGSKGVSKYKVIEVKLNQSIFPDDIKQLLTYLDWVTENLAEGESSFVDGYIVANDFQQDCINFVSTHNHVNDGRKISLLSFNYVPPSYHTLAVNKVV